MAVVERPTTWYEDIQEKMGRFKPVMLDAVEEELAGLARKGGKRGRHAALASELGAGFLKVKGVRGGGSTDDAILSWAASNNAAVATIDGKMLEYLRAARIRSVTLRSGRVHIY
jgi:rRNA-processing protein FCF1